MKLIRYILAIPSKVFITGISISWIDLYIKAIFKRGYIVDVNTIQVVEERRKEEITK